MGGQVFNIETDNRSLPAQQFAQRDEGLWALVPVKALEGANYRLKKCLGADREGFTVAMLKDVLAALGESKQVSHIAVVTGDPRVAAIAKQGGLVVIEEVESKGLNEALELGRDAIRFTTGHQRNIRRNDHHALSTHSPDRIAP